MPRFCSSASFTASSTDNRRTAAGGAWAGVVSEACAKASDEISTAAANTNLRDMRHHSVKENRSVPKNRRSPAASGSARTRNVYYESMKREALLELFRTSGALLDGHF